MCFPITRLVYSTHLLTINIIVKCIYCYRILDIDATSIKISFSERNIEIEKLRGHASRCSRHESQMALVRGIACITRTYIHNTRRVHVAARRDDDVAFHARHASRGVAYAACKRDLRLLISRICNLPVAKTPTYSFLFYLFLINIAIEIL